MSLDFYALLLTLGAGMATPLGGALALIGRRGSHEDRLLALGMGLAGGVLLYLALQGLLPEAYEELVSLYGERGHLLALVGFAGGMAVMALLDRLLPGSSHHTHHDNGMRITEDAEEKRSLLISGLAAAIAISIHNIPEGMMLYLTAAESPMEGIPVMLAVGMHNIPIGLSIAIPIYYAGYGRIRVLLVCLLSGVMELIGAVLGAFLSAPMESPLFLGLMLALIAGIMVYVSFDELIPAAYSYGRRHASLYGILLGLLFMGLTMALIHH